MNPERFRAIRHKHGLTQGQLGAMLGQTARAVRRWEAGDNQIPQEIAMLMEVLQGQGVDWLQHLATFVAS